jgi:hypothetical protein
MMRAADVMLGGPVMTVLRNYELFADEGQWLRALLVDVQARMELVPPESAVERIRRRLEAEMAVKVAGVRAA